MRWHLDWVETLAVLALGIGFGWTTSALLRNSGLRRAWAVLCPVLFVACGLAGIVFDIMPRLADATMHDAVQAGALAAFVAGMTYATIDA